MKIQIKSKLRALPQGMTPRRIAMMLIKESMKENKFKDFNLREYITLMQGNFSNSPTKLIKMGRMAGMIADELTDRGSLTIFDDNDEVSDDSLFNDVKAEIEEIVELSINKNFPDNQ